MSRATKTNREEVLWLLARKTSQRTIAAKLGITRRSVERIAMSQAKTESPVLLVDGIRCPGCKAKLNRLPCVTCESFCPDCKVYTGGGPCARCRARAK